jgi:hypothetical protein
MYLSLFFFFTTHTLGIRGCVTMTTYTTRIDVLFGSFSLLFSQFPYLIGFASQSVTHSSALRAAIVVVPSIDAGRTPPVAPPIETEEDGPCMCVAQCLLLLCAHPPALTAPIYNNEGRRRPKVSASDAHINNGDLLALSLLYKKSFCLIHFLAV